jgi:hypothetical protein
MGRVNAKRNRTGPHIADGVGPKPFSELVQGRSAARRRRRRGKGSGFRKCINH